MKVSKFMIAPLVAGMCIFASCSGANASSKSDTDTTVPAEEVVTDSTPADTIASIFADSTKAASVATDSTYAETPSGLKYMVIKEGTGKTPTATDLVTVHYTGKLVDGTVFDSSVVRGEPATFPLNRVIPGWTEGLQLMKEGGVTIFYIPSELAYGPNGAPPVIGPDADLIFEVELIKVGQ